MESCERKVRKFFRLLLLGVIVVFAWFSLVGVVFSGLMLERVRIGEILGYAVTYLGGLVVSVVTLLLLVIYAAWVRPWRTPKDQWVFCFHALMVICTVLSWAGPYVWFWYVLN